MDRKMVKTTKKLAKRYQINFQKLVKMIKNSVNKMYRYYSGFSSKVICTILQVYIVETCCGQNIAVTEKVLMEQTKTCSWSVCVFD